VPRLGLAAAIVIGALSGCGGGGDDTAGSPPTKGTTAAHEKTSGPTDTSTRGNGGFQGRPRTAKVQVRLAVEGVLASSDPADACARFVTKRYLRVAYGGQLGCVQAQAPGSVARRLDHKDLRIDDDRATVVVVPSGGPYDGERVTVSLVRDGPRWAVDELDADVPVGP
jgi:hypothetical protein